MHQTHLGPVPFSLKSFLQRLPRELGADVMLPSPHPTNEKCARARLSSRHTRGTKEREQLTAGR